MTTTGIKKWSLTPGNNDAAVPNGAPEGWAPSQVNDVIRQIMTEVRNWYEDPAWIDYGYTYLFVSTTQFRVGGIDVSAKYAVNRRIRAQGSATGTIYGYVSAVSFSTDTTVTVVWDSGTLSNETLVISVGMPSAGGPIPASSLSGQLPALDGSLLINLPAQITMLPVGSIYLNASDATNPATLLGYGTWTAMGQGRVLVGVGTGTDGNSDTLAPTAGATGGEYNHALTSVENAAHTHPIQTKDESPSGGSYQGIISSAGNASTGPVLSHATDSSGSGTKHNNTQPWIGVYIWTRTA